VTPEQQVLDAAKAFAAVEADYRVNKSKELCEKVEASLNAFDEYSRANPGGVYKDDYNPPELVSSCWSDAVTEAIDHNEGEYEQIWPDDTWCPAGRHNWQKKQDRRRIVNRRIGAIRRLTNAVARMEAAHEQG
jgi:hypothetical protein